MTPSPSIPLHRRRSTLYGSLFAIVLIGLIGLWGYTRSLEGAGIEPPAGWVEATADELVGSGETVWWLGRAPVGINEPTILFARPDGTDAPDADEQAFALISYLGREEKTLTVSSGRVAAPTHQAMVETISACRSGACPEGKRLIETPAGAGLAADRRDISTLVVPQDDGLVVTLVVFAAGGIGDYPAALQPLTP